MLFLHTVKDNISDEYLFSQLDTTMHISIIIFVKQRLKNGTRISVPCPKSIQLYNTFMGEVDLNDQLRGYYSVRLKGCKYYKYLWWFLFDIAITNAYILSKLHSNLTI